MPRKNRKAAKKKSSSEDDPLDDEFDDGAPRSASNSDSELSDTESEDEQVTSLRKDFEEAFKADSTKQLVAVIENSQGVRELASQRKKAKNVLNKLTAATQARESLVRALAVDANVCARWLAGRRRWWAG